MREQISVDIMWFVLTYSQCWELLYQWESSHGLTFFLLLTWLDVYVLFYYFAQLLFYFFYFWFYVLVVKGTSLAVVLTQLLFSWCPGNKFGDIWSSLPGFWFFCNVHSWIPGHTWRGCWCSIYGFISLNPKPYNGLCMRLRSNSACLAALWSLF